ncbi:MAG: hypothetical protein PW788_16100 [Micavibrio sp.]|nr:hypothetical protein [Micavibrio sp.]
MSLSPKANAAYQRYSKGPLYSARELIKAETFLALDGFIRVEDSISLGMRIYNKADQSTGSASVYLDELNCHPNNSGTVIISQPGQEMYVGTIWEYVKQKQAATPRAPLSTLLKKLNPFR